MEPLREELLRAATGSSQRQPRRAARLSSDAEHPGCVPTAAVPSQSSLPALRCSGARQRAQPAGSAPGAREAARRAGTRPPGPGRPGTALCAWKGCPKATGRARVMRAARRLRLQLFVRAADGSAERSRLCPAMAALTSKCTLSPQSIIVSSVPTIALWCCIVLLPPSAPSTAFTAIHQCESRA